MATAVQEEKNAATDQHQDSEHGAAVEKPIMYENAIQIASDLHLEFGETLDLMPEIVPQAPVLALLGDIGYPADKSYSKFILKMSKQFRHVIIIAGNHEYYNNEFYYVNEIIEKLCDQISNVTFLNCGALELPHLLPNTRILGCTLWVDYPKKAHGYYKQVVNDFNTIQYNPNNPKLTKKIVKNSKKDSHKRNSKIKGNNSGGGRSSLLGPFYNINNNKKKNRNSFKKNKKSKLGSGLANISENSYGDSTDGNNNRMDLMDDGMMPPTVDKLRSVSASSAFESSDETNKNSNKKFYHVTNPSADSALTLMSRDSTMDDRDERDMSRTHTNTENRDLNRLRAGSLESSVSGQQNMIGASSNNYNSIKSTSIQTPFSPIHPTVDNGSPVITPMTINQHFDSSSYNSVDKEKEKDKDKEKNKEKEKEKDKFSSRAQALTTISSEKENKTQDSSSNKYKNNNNNNDSNKNETKESKENEDKEKYRWTPEIANSIHLRHKQWLEKELSSIESENKQLKTNTQAIILTHHGPTDFACNGLSILSTPVTYSTNYSNNEELFFNYANIIKGWFFGHTHYNSDIMIRVDTNGNSSRNRQSSNTSSTSVPSSVSNPTGTIINNSNIVSNNNNNNNNSNMNNGNSDYNNNNGNNNSNSGKNLGNYNSNVNNNSSNNYNSSTIGMNSTSSSNFDLSSVGNVNYIRVASNQLGYIYSRRAKYYLPNKVITFPNFNFVLNGNCVEFDLIKKYARFKVEYIKETEEIDEKNKENGEKQVVRIREVPLDDKYQKIQESGKAPSNKSSNVKAIASKFARELKGRDIRLKCVLIDYSTLLNERNSKSDYVPKDGTIKGHPIKDENGNEKGKDCIVM